MAQTKVWTSFGSSISKHPNITLGAFLEQPKAIAEAKDHNIKYPSYLDFKNDEAYDPNPHMLELSEAYIQNTGLILSLMTWGPDLMARIVHACSLLQCAQQMQGKAELLSLRDQAAWAVHSYVNVPSAKHLRAVSKAAKRCDVHYGKYADDPDSQDACEIWSTLGAPWHAAATISSDWSLQDYDGDGPREAQSTWINRNSVNPCNCTDALSEWVADEFVLSLIKATALAWASSK